MNTETRWKVGREMTESKIKERNDRKRNQLTDKWEHGEVVSFRELVGLGPDEVEIEVETAAGDEDGEE